MAAVGIDLRDFISERTGAGWFKFGGLALLFSVGIWTLPVGIYWSVFKGVEISVLVYQLAIVTVALAYLNALLFRFLSRNKSANYSRSLIFRQLCIVGLFIAGASYVVNSLLAVPSGVTYSLVIANVELGLLISLFYVNIELGRYRLTGAVGVFLVLTIIAALAFPLNLDFGLAVLYFCALALMMSIPRESEFDQRSFFRNGTFISLASLCFVLGFWVDKLVFVQNISVHSVAGSSIIDALTLAFFITLPVNILIFLITEYYWGYHFFKLRKVLTAVNANIDRAEREFTVSLRRIVYLVILAFALLAVVYQTIVPAEATLVVLSLISQFFAQVFFVFLVYFGRDGTLFWMSCFYLVGVFLLVNRIDMEQYFGMSLFICNLMFSVVAILLLKFDIENAMVRIFGDA